MMKNMLTVALLLPASAMALDEIVGEWSVDAESCRESRLVFDIDGKHYAMLAEEGRWKTLGVAEYEREGDVIIVRHGATEERIEILEQHRDRLVLRNRASAAGNLTTELVRCPAY